MRAASAAALLPACPCHCDMPLLIPQCSTAILPLWHYDTAAAGAAALWLNSWRQIVDPAVCATSAFMPNLPKGHLTLRSVLFEHVPVITMDNAPGCQTIGSKPSALSAHADEYADEHLATETSRRLVALLDATLFWRNRDGKSCAQVQSPCRPRLSIAR